jgi:hypothetical protein
MVSNTELKKSSHSSSPRAEYYDAYSQNWIGKIFTFKGGVPMHVIVNNDDTDFKDAYVETGTRRNLREAISIDGTTYPSDSVVEKEFFMADKFGNEVFVVRINGQSVGLSYPVGQYPMYGHAFSCDKGMNYSAANNSVEKLEYDARKADVVCFAEGVLIQTPLGTSKVEELEIGDSVNTLDNGPQVVRWVHSSVQALPIGHAKEAIPVLIKAGALGPARPEHDLVVSPQHRVLVGGHGQLQDQFKSIGFAKAKSLTSLRRVRQMRGMQEIKWIHFAFDRQEVIYANGCLSVLPHREKCLS